MSKNTRADESILNLASSKRRSLRVTVPSFIVDQFEFKQGDTLRWKIEGDSVIIKKKTE